MFVLKKVIDIYVKSVGERNVAQWEKFLLMCGGSLLVHTERVSPSSQCCIIGVDPGRLYRVCGMVDIKIPGC